MIKLTKIGIESSLQKRESFLSVLNIKRKEEGVLLQTCNRVEWYYGAGIISEEISRHLFRVVSGLESTIIGETAIVQQVKTAYLDAMSKTKLDKGLHKLFQTAFSVGKKVRNETGISKGAVSHSQAAVNLLFHEIGSFSNLNTTIIGANALKENIIKFLIRKGANTIFIGNRTYEKAQILAEKYRVMALRFEHLHEILRNTDILISATSAPHYILKKENFSPEKNIHILDLAVPRDVEPEIGNLKYVNLYNIEIIEKQIQNNLSKRKEKISRAEEIIENEVRLFSQNKFYEKSNRQ